jgi:hypothetical protein
MTLAPGYVYYWTHGSCQVYMNNKLQPAQDIYYCYDYGNCASSLSCAIRVLTPSVPVAGVVNYLAWNCQGTTGHNGGSCHFYDNTGVCASLFPLLLGSAGLTAKRLHSVDPGPDGLSVWSSRGYIMAAHALIS